MYNVLAFDMSLRRIPLTTNFNNYFSYAVNVNGDYHCLYTMLSISLYFYMLYLYFHSKLIIPMVINCNVFFDLEKQCLFKYANLDRVLSEKLFKFWERCNSSSSEVNTDVNGGVIKIVQLPNLT